MKSEDRPVSLSEPLLTREEAVGLLSVSPSWLRDAATARRVPFIRIGKHIRFERRALEVWLGECRHEGKSWR